MKKIILFSFLFFAALDPTTTCAEEFVTSDVLQASQVEYFVKEIVAKKPKQTFNKMIGVYQAQDNPKLAKIFYEVTTTGRKGPTKAKGEFLCFKLNDKRWYCGRGYDYLRK